MQKKLKKPGKSTLACAEIQHISKHGLWLLINDQEFFLPFSDFPWFKDATIDQLCTLEFTFEKYLHWPLLDIDIEVASLKYPDAYPLTYK
jgi:hypothetical protein